MNRTDFNNALRMMFGNKCSNCGAPHKKRRLVNRRGEVERHSNLQFHHLDPSAKVVEVTAAKTRADAYAEAQKCVLLCTRCHDNYHECVEFFDDPPANDNQRTSVANDIVDADWSDVE